MFMEVVVSVMLLLAGITVIVIIHICIVGRTFTQDYNSGAIIVQRVVKRWPTMSQNDIEKLPSFDYKVEEKGNGGSPMECAVCLENFKDGENCRLLPKCNHTFHSQCIDSWLLKTAACPICREGAIHIPPSAEQDRDSSEGAELA